MFMGSSGSSDFFYIFYLTAEYVQYCLNGGLGFRPIPKTRLARGGRVVPRRRSWRGLAFAGHDRDSAAGDRLGQMFEPTALALELRTQGFVHGCERECDEVALDRDALGLGDHHAEEHLVLFPDGGKQSTLQVGTRGSLGFLRVPRGSLGFRGS